MAYTNLFFDLDRTLWDFEANAIEAFQDIFVDYSLQRYFPGVESFVQTYEKYNEELWDQYRKGLIKKDFLRNYRFKLTLMDYGVDDDVLARKISDRYLEVAPQKSNLVPGTQEVISHLSGKYRLYILTNGFSEVQGVKMKSTGLDRHFKYMFTSDEAGYQKPNPKIFEYALKNLNAKKVESIMIGDDLEVDVLGAKHFGMDQVFFNPKKVNHREELTYEINSLKELLAIF